MNRINILYLITKLELGGAQKHVLSLVKNADKNRFNVFLFTSKDGLLLDEAFLIPGVTIYCSRFLDRPINFFKDILAFFEIVFYLKYKNIKIIHTHSSKAGILGRLAAKFANIPIVIHTVHGWSFNDYQPYFIRKIYVLLERIVAFFSDVIIVVSSYDRQKGLSNAIGSKEKYLVIPYGIDYPKFINLESNIRKRLGINPDEEVVGTIACLKPQKAPSDFIKVCSHISNLLPKVKFLLVGDGILKKKIIKLIKGYNLSHKVIMTGWCRNVSEILSVIDVFVLTSLWEGVPISVLEAMAASKPVVVTRTGGIEEIIRDGENGYLVFPRDILNMVKIVQGLLVDKELRLKVGRNAKFSLGDSFLIERMIKDNLAIYERLIVKKNL